MLASCGVVLAIAMMLFGVFGIGGLISDQRDPYVDRTVPLRLAAMVVIGFGLGSVTLYRSIRAIARRRHKRGFPVQPKGGGEAVSAPQSSPARASDR